MDFAWPIWLVLLAPWTALALWLLWSRRRTQVPFLELWRRLVEGRRARRVWRVPPAGLVLALIAALLAIFAAAGPNLGRRGTTRPIVGIVVDRGLSMSARTEQRDRLHTAIDRAAERLGPLVGAGQIECVSTPGKLSQRMNWDQWNRWSDPLRPTAMRTDALLTAAVREELQRTDGPVIVLSDQDSGVESDRLIRISPGLMPAYAGIESVAARASPRPQVMVRLSNRTTLRSAILSVTSGDQLVRQTVQLPQDGVRDEFVDLPRLGPTVRVEIAADDPLDAEHQAFLVRRGAWPRLEPMSPLPAELRRMVEIHSRLRPVTPESQPVSIVAAGGTGGRGAPIPQGPAVVFVPPTLALDRIAGAVKMAKAANDLTAEIDWPAILADARVGPAAPPGPGWTPLLTAGSQVLLAVRMQPQRQAWVGFDSPGFARDSSYVVFWSRLLEWVGNGGGETYEAEPAKPLGPGWEAAELAVGSTEAVEAGLWPGIYQRSDGTMCAVNAGEPGPHVVAASDWDRLDRWEVQRRMAGGASATAAFATAALAAMAAAVGVWPRRRLTASAQPRTF